MDNGYRREFPGFGKCALKYFGVKGIVSTTYSKMIHRKKPWVHPPGLALTGEEREEGKRIKQRDRIVTLGNLKVIQKNSLYYCNFSLNANYVKINTVLN